MTEFGMPTLVELPSLEENARLAAALGLKFVEVNMNLPMYQAHRLTRERLAPRDGVYFTLHLDEGLNPFDFNPLVREAYLRTAENTVRLAAESGVPCVNLHMPEGVHFKLPGRKVYLFDEYREEYRASLLAFRERMARAADGRVTVLVENTCFTRLRGLPEALDTLLESPAFALTYDAGHDACDGFAAAEFYRAREGRVKHVHLHQANETTCHLPLGGGRVDENDWLARAENGGMRVVIEVKSREGLERSVNALRERNAIA